LGINHSGIITLQGSRKTNHFKWSEVQKINYEGKMFIIHLVFMEDPRNKVKDPVLIFLGGLNFRLSNV